VKVRITETPAELEVDGVSLARLRAGTVCRVSTSLGTWLMAEGYAELEMRREPELSEKLSSVAERPHVAHDRRRKPSRSG
jgi:hypothetical protein